MLSKCPGKKGIFKELRVRFVIFPKIIISEQFFVSNNSVSESKGHTGRNSVVDLVSLVLGGLLYLRTARRDVSGSLQSLTSDVLSVAVGCVFLFSGLQTIANSTM